MLLALVACKGPPEASPPDMQELARSMLRDFDTDDEATEAQELKDWLDANWEPDPEDGYQLDALSEEYVAGLDYPEETDFSRALGAIVPRHTEGGIDAQSAVVPEEDQTFASAHRTYSKWDRTIVSGSADDYLAGGDLGTDNDVEKTNVGVTIDYGMSKDYRWIELPDGSPAQVFRTWITRSGESADGKNQVVGGFTIEVWYPEDDGVLWVNASWSDFRTAVDDVLTEDFLVNELIDGTIDYMKGTEEHVLGEDE
jgi:hypothetical protein